VCANYYFKSNIQFRVPYSQRYLFDAISDINHNANPTNPTNPTNPNTCEYGTYKLNGCLF